MKFLLPVDIPEIEYDFYLEEQLVHCVQDGGMIDIDRLDWREPDYYEAIKPSIRLKELSDRESAWARRRDREKLEDDLESERKCLARQIEHEVQSDKYRQRLLRVGGEKPDIEWEAWKIEHDADWEKVNGYRPD